MRIGVVFPQTEIGADPAGVRDYAQAVEELGYRHILVYDHVLGASTRSRPGWTGAYNSDDMFHEVFVLYGYLAAITRTIELVTGVLVLPQRQTALVAKQAAAIDVLSGGRLRLGIGVGWNAVEYQALNENFHNRGARSEEQIALLRALWTEPAVTFKGRWHTVEDAGLNPLPVQRPAPVAQLAWRPAQRAAVVAALQGQLMMAERVPPRRGVPVGGREDRHDPLTGFSTGRLRWSPRRSRAGRSTARPRRPRPGARRPGPGAARRPRRRG